MTDTIAKILSDRDLVRAFDDAQITLIESVLKRHLQAAPVAAPVKSEAAPILQGAVEPNEDGVYVVDVDGACSGNGAEGGAPGGWAAAFECGAILVGGDDLTTNNRMEIEAAIAAIAATPAGSVVRVITDSKLVVETMNSGWKRNVNIELWQKLDEVRVGRKVSFQWVKGHSGSAGNERANQFAQEEAQRRRQKKAA